MLGSSANGGGVPSPTFPGRLSIVLTAVLIVVLVSAPVGTAQSGALQPKHTAPLVQKPTADQLKTLRQRAEQGDAASACQLGTIYENGQGVRKDSAEAYKWFDVGFTLSHDLQNSCVDNHDRLRKQMSSTQIDEGFKRAQDWREMAHFTPAVPRTQVRPDYTPKTLKAGITGVVLLDVVIGIDGTVVEHRVVQSLDEELDQQAVKAVRQWRFTPATFGGTPVPMVALMSMSFETR